MAKLDESRLDEYLASVDKKIEAAGGNTWSCLSEPELVTITAYFLALEISNGGIEQFFVNPTGDRWRETLSAIKTVGATKLASLFEEALSVFPDCAPSEDQVTRCAQLAAAGQPAIDLLSRLTSEYYNRSAEDCLYQLLTAFAIRQMEGKDP
jgi:hypothetical protein